VFKLHLGELCWNTTAALKKCDALFARFADVRSSLVVDSEVHDLCLQIIGHADHVRKILFSDGPRGKNEEPKRAQMRQTRSRFLQCLLKGVDVTHLKQAAVRNAMAHFDERIDQLIIKLNKKRLPKDRQADIVYYNLSIETDELLKSLAPWSIVNPEYIRAYFYGPKVYVHFGHKFDLGALYDELYAVNKTLRDQMPGSMFEDGGLFLVLPDASYEANGVTIAV